MSSATQTTHTFIYFSFYISQISVEKSVEKRFVAAAAAFCCCCCVHYLPNTSPIPSSPPMALAHVDKVQLVSVSQLQQSNKEEKKASWGSNEILKALLNNFEVEGITPIIILSSFCHSFSSYLFNFLSQILAGVV